jgi:hypothetical protein
MLTQQIALVSETSTITPSELTKVAAALQKQVVRDFAPIWEVKATVDAFVNLDDVPLGYWRIVVKDDIKVKALGIHRDENGQPFSLVRFMPGWSLTASHECLEMLADPFGNRLIAGQSPKPDQGRVEFLVEVADPCEADAFAYLVNGITVSDFYTPHYFDPVTAPGVRYSFSGRITAPRQVLPGGYLSWHDPIGGHWWQLQFFHGEEKIVDVGVLPPLGSESIRGIIDRKTNPQMRGDGFKAESRLAETTQAKAHALRKAIAALEKE